MSTIINGTSDAITFPDSTVQNTAATNYSAGGTITGNLSVTGNLSFNSGYGSDAVAYGCRAWVNFNGTGTVAIRASGNVSSITDNGEGDYTVNFSNAMPDVNYSFVATSDNDENGSTDAYTVPSNRGTDTYLTSSVRFSVVRLRFDAQQFRDATIVTVAIFR
jgi:hypothetical protein